MGCSMFVGDVGGKGEVVNDPLGRTWEVVGPTRRKLTLTPHKDRDWFSLVDADACGNGLIPVAGLISLDQATAWFGDGVLSLQPGESMNVWGVFGVEKEKGS